MKPRLVKVLVQPVFVLDDGEHLREANHGVVEVSAEEWPTYATGRFAAELEKWAREMNGSDDHDHPDRP